VVHTCTLGGMAKNRVVNLANFEQFTAINVLGDPGAIGGPKVIPSCAEIDLVWALPGGGLGHNILTGRYTGAFSGTPAQASAILAALTTGGPATALFTHIATTAVLGSVLIRDIGVPNGPLIANTNTGIAGSAAGAALPNEVALVITKHTALAGRANRGRMYVPGFSVAAVAADNTAVPAVITDLQAWANTIQGALNASGYTLVIGQPARAAYIGTTGTSHPARPAGSVTVSSMFVRDNHFDSQRRRGLK
jgi:hypothetical protein